MIETFTTMLQTKLHFYGTCFYTFVNYPIGRVPRRKLRDLAFDCFSHPYTLNICIYYTQTPSIFFKFFCQGADLDCVGKCRQRGSHRAGQELGSDPLQRSVQRVGVSAQQCPPSSIAGPPSIGLASALGSTSRRGLMLPLPRRTLSKVNNFIKKKPIDTQYW